jgi:putative heme-binding domain-containing protein
MVAPPEGKPVEPWQLAALGGLMDALQRRGQDLESVSASAGTAGRSALAHFQQAFAGARELAQNESADEATRIAAIGLLGRSPKQFDADLDLLRKVIEPPTTLSLQTAAVAALGRTRSPKAPGLLLADWPHHSPSLRIVILGALLARDEWILPLLDAMEKGSIAASELPPANRQRLLKHKKETIARRAGALLSGTQSASRAEVLVKYQGVTNLTGDPGRGEAVFGTNCASCHALGGQGHAVGPELAAFRTKAPQDFLLAIIDPNAAIEPRFINYLIETKDGRALSGVVKAETATGLTLVQGGGLEEKILRNDIAEIKASNLSLMPEGLEQTMTPQDLANLIAFLKYAGPQTFGRATPEQAAKARGEFVKAGANGLARIVSSAGQLPYPGWLGTLPMPFCRQTDGKSELVWETMPVRKGLKPNETESFRLPAAMGFLSQPSGSFQLLLNDKPGLEFNVALNSQNWQSGDGRIRMNYVVTENNDEDSCGVLQINAAGSLLEPGKPVRFEVVGSAASSQRWFGVYLLPVAEH